MLITGKSLFQTDIFTLCGYFSAFNIYPKYTAGTMRFTKIFRMRFIFNASYSVIDQGLVFSTQLPDKLEIARTPFSHYFIDFSTVLTFHVVTEEFNNLVFQYENVKEENIALIHDGPGFLATVLQLIPNKLLKTSTFQCVVVFFYHDHTVHVGSSLKYSSNLILVNKFISLNVSINLVSDKLLASNLYSISVQRSKYQINGSIDKLSYHGTLDPRCSFGGLVIVEKLAGSYQEGLKFCEKSYGINRNFYSHESSLILVFYWYQSYTEINITIHLTETMCKPVIFDPCYYKELLLFNATLATETPGAYLKRIIHTADVRFHDIKGLSSHGEFLLDLGTENCVVVQSAIRHFQNFNDFLFIDFADEGCHFQLSMFDPSKYLIAADVRGKMSDPAHGRLNDEYAAFYITKLCPDPSCSRDEYGFKIPTKTFLVITRYFHRLEGLIIDGISVYLPFLSNSWLDVTVRKMNHYNPKRNLRQSSTTFPLGVPSSIVSHSGQRLDISQYVFVFKLESKDQTDPSLDRSLLHLSFQHSASHSIDLFNLNIPDLINWKMLGVSKIMKGKIVYYKY